MTLSTYLQSKAQATERYHADQRPERLLYRLSQAADRCCLDVLASCALPQGAAVVAVGGYGRQELYPESDVDVLIVLAHPPTEADTQRIQTLIAKLWDQGLKLSHAVRTVEQCLDEARLNIATQTALLELRHLFGEVNLTHSLQQRLQAALDPQAFFLAKRVEMQQRHRRYHDTPYALEPNCKESPGGLRDLQVLLWLANAAGLGHSWKDIAQSGLLTEAERRAVHRSALAFMGLRIELHLLTGRAEDRVLFDLQPKLAERYGFVDQSHRRASELLMQRYYWAARLVSQLNLILMQDLEERLFPAAAAAPQPIDDDFIILNNRLELLDTERLHAQPGLIFQCFLHLQAFPQLQGLSASTLRALWHGRRLIDAHFRAQPAHQALFIELFKAKRGIVQTLRLMTMLNILPRYLPAFRRVVGQMQHDLFHVYTVDQHTLMVIRNLRRFTMADYAEDHPLANQLAPSFDRYWVLYLAALFHDIGKGQGGNHSELGAQAAAQFCAQHPISPEDTELIVWLVRDHLQLSHVAQKKDIRNPEVIAAFTEALPSTRALTALYLLTVADIRGTSPTIWNSWKAKLLNDLYQISLRALGSNDYQTSTVLAQRKSVARSQLLQLGLTDSAIDNFWSVLDMDYFLRHDSEDIVWHTQHLYGALLHAHPIVESQELGRDATRQVLVYAPDRTELFMQICYYFDHFDLSIQDARIYTTAHGWALDSFIVLVPDSLQGVRSIASTLKTHFEAWLNDPPPLPEPLNAAAPHISRSARAKTFPITPSFSLEANANTGIWRLSVVTADRKGLLFQLAQLFSHYALNLRSAKIMTLGERVEDSFYFFGTQLDQPTCLRNFERELASILA
ncbi:MAG TPA: [protein-PII] uridylyltransferase [Candidatus Paenalcaligenes intestinipullorum]|uniref:Bifunctional uridylyltransferase/uridylyl-removing enzyme n=1 Tax=Candidatus Paenalcaligenes intestinipullorum TaxID=2838718 RepID=A0A9D2U826_9BURK|nr:[protein-PII] uridylyltransferase [Candidatus Paenalcaligenes intestinipullorum]